MLFSFKREVVLLVQFKELFPVAARKIIPLAGSHTETIFLGITQEVHKGLDSEIVPDSVAFNRAARAADIDGVADTVFSGYREPYLAPTECRKIDFFREAKCNTVAI